MRTTILIATILIFSGDLFSQGGVDVRYVAIDTLNKSLIGQKIKIDFKSSNGTKRHVMQKARIRDTVAITINDKPFTLFERKGTGTDYWYFDKEYLESFDYNPGLILRIKDIEIVDMSDDSILFRMTLDQFRKVKDNLEQVSSETTDTWILRDKIEGVLIRE